MKVITSEPNLPFTLFDKFGETVLAGVSNSECVYEEDVEGIEKDFVQYVHKSYEEKVIFCYAIGTIVDYKGKPTEIKAQANHGDSHMYFVKNDWVEEYEVKTWPRKQAKERL